MQSCLQVRTRIQSSLELLQEENSFAYYSRNWPNSTYLQNVTIVAEQRGALGVVSIIFAVHTPRWGHFSVTPVDIWWFAPLRQNSMRRGL